MTEAHEQILYRTDSGVVTRKNISEALTRVGLSRGDVIMIHSDVGTFGKLGTVLDRNQFLSEILAAFLDVISDQGTIIVPTYTYSFCKKEIYDVKNSISDTGVFSEYVRRRPECLRSEDPIFSHAGFGPVAHELLQDVGRDCFGNNSFFDRFCKRNGRIVNFGKFFDITFIYYIEQEIGVSYRYMKQFTGQIQNKSGQLRSTTVNYYVRYLPEDGMDVEYDMSKLRDELERQGRLKRVLLGSSHVLCSKAQDCFNVGCQMLRQNEYAFLKHPPVISRPKGSR